MSTVSSDLPKKQPRKSRNSASATDELTSHLRRTASFIKVFDLMIEGFTWLGAMAAAWLMLCLVDHWVSPLVPVLRWFAWLAIVGFSVYVLLHRILPLLLGRINLDYAAKRIENAEPRFKEGLLAWLQLSQRADSGVPRGVMSALTYRAYRFIGGQDPSSTVDSSPLIRSLATFLVLSLVMILYSFVSPKSSLATAQRVAMPWRDIAPPTRVKISNIQPGDAVITAGKPLPISARCSGLLDGEPVRIVFTSRDGQFINQTISLSEPDVGSLFEGELRTTKHGVEHKLDYWIEAGDARSERFSVDLSPVPTLTLERVELIPPPYTKLPKRISDGQNIEGVEGTRAKFILRTNQPLERAQLEINPQVNEKGQTRAAEHYIAAEIDNLDLSADWLFELEQAGALSREIQYCFRGSNERGDYNDQPVIHDLRVVRDVPPTVEILGPESRILNVHPATRLNLDVRASDPDYGLRDVRLSIHRSGMKMAERTILKGESLTGKQSRKQPLDLRSLKLRPGDRIEIRASARDNRHDPRTNQWSPNETDATPLIIQVIDRDKPADVPRQPAETPEETPPTNADASAGEPGKENTQGTAQENAQGTSGGQTGGADNSPDASSGEQSGVNGSSDAGDGGSGTENQSGDQAGGNSGKSGNQAANDQSSSDQAAGNQGTGNQGTGSQGVGGQSQSNESTGQGNSGTSNSNSTGSASGENSTGSADGNSGSNSATNGSRNNADRSSSTSSTQAAGKNADGSASSTNARSDGGSASQPDPASSSSGAAEAIDKVREYMQQNKSQQSEGNQSPNGQQSDSSATGSSGSQQQNGESGTGSNSNGDASSGTSPSDSQLDNPSSRQSPNAPGDNAQGSNENGTGRQNDSGAPDKSASGNQPSDSGTSGEQSGSEQSSGEQNAGRSDGEQQNTGNRSDADQPAGASDSGKSSQSGSSANQPGDSQSGNSQSGNSQSGNSQSGNSQSGDSQSGNSGKGDNGQSNPGQTGAGSEASSAGGDPNSASGGSEGSKEAGSGNGSPPKSSDQQSGGKQNGDQQSNAEQNATGENSTDNNAEQTNTNGGSGEQSGNGSGSGQPSRPDTATNSEQASREDNNSQSSNSDSQSNSQSPSSAASSAASAAKSQSSGIQPGSSGKPSSSGEGESPTGSGASSGIGNSGDTTAPTSAAVDRAAAERSADMVLDYLDRQRDQPDPELLREINWSQRDLNQFVDRWKSARELADKGEPASSQKWEELLNALQLKSANTGRLDRSRLTDDFRQMSDSIGNRNVPRGLKKRWEAFQRATQSNQ